MKTILSILFTALLLSLQAQTFNLANTIEIPNNGTDMGFVSSPDANGNFIEYQSPNGKSIDIYRFDNFTPTKLITLKRDSRNVFCTLISFGGKICYLYGEGAPKTKAIWLDVYDDSIGNQEKHIKIGSADSYIAVDLPVVTFSENKHFFSIDYEERSENDSVYHRFSVYNVDFKLISTVLIPLPASKNKITTRLVDNNGMLYFIENLFKTKGKKGKPEYSTEKMLLNCIDTTSTQELIPIPLKQDHILSVQLSVGKSSLLVLDVLYGRKADEATGIAHFNFYKEKKELVEYASFGFELSDSERKMLSYSFSEIENRDVSKNFKLQNFLFKRHYLLSDGSSIMVLEKNETLLNDDLNKYYHTGTVIVYRLSAEGKIQWIEIGGKSFFSSDYRPLSFVSTLTDGKLTLLFNGYLSNHDSEVREKLLIGENCIAAMTFDTKNGKLEEKLIVRPEQTLPKSVAYIHSSTVDQNGHLIIVPIMGIKKMGVGLFHID